MGCLKFYNLSGPVLLVTYYVCRKSNVLKVDNNNDSQARCKFLHLYAYNLTNQVLKCLGV